jgi:hypothetical protein
VKTHHPLSTYHIRSNSLQSVRWNRSVQDRVGLIDFGVSFNGN